jgi:hypothetical protein
MLTSVGTWFFEHKRHCRLDVNWFLDHGSTAPFCCGTQAAI